MKTILQTFLPEKADNQLRGSRLAYLLYVGTAVIWTLRSLIHIFSPDGGAGSIAGMNLDHAGANEVIFAFALWGSEQLIYSLMKWIVIFRYRSLIPLMWVIQLLETAGRMLVGRLKPVQFSHTPPGEIGNYVYLALSIAMLLLIFGQAIQSAQPEEQSA